MNLYYLVSLALCCGLISGADEVVVRIPNGSVRGQTQRSYFDREFRSFRGVPFGKSTAGENRFKPPQAVDNWDGVLNATESSEECAQFNFVTRGVEGSEDCLYLNVFTPLKSNSKKSLPVMVFIHGGAFVMGTGNYYMYPPEKLMDYDVVLVTFNYRLGVLGFLNTNDDEAYGNLGMLDQVLALKWVHDNIEHFGGNRDKVIIFGESAGSTSVVYHMMSNLSKGLFHGAIAQSGALLTGFSFLQDPMKGAYLLAANLDCPTQSSKALVDCFRSKSVYDLLRADRLLRKTHFFPLYWSLSKEIGNSPGFLREDPRILLKNKQIANPVPLIAGILPHEGYLFHKEFLSLFSQRGIKRVDELKDVLNLIMKDPPNIENVYLAIRKRYFDHPNIGEDEVFRQALIRLMTDMSFGASVSKTIDYFSEAGVPVYAYLMSHVGEHSLAGMFGLPTGEYASHGDELFLQFPMLYTQYIKMNEDDTKMSILLNTLWTTFADTLNPKASIDDKPLVWPLHTSENPKYLHLNLKPEIVKGTLSNETKFWIETIPEIMRNVDSLKSEL